MLNRSEWDSTDEELPLLDHELSRVVFDDTVPAIICDLLVLVTVGRHVSAGETGTAQLQVPREGDVYLLVVARV